MKYVACLAFVDSDLGAERAIYRLLRCLQERQQRHEHAVAMEAIRQR
jgi:hypothetical protein